ncbi:MAG: hypothetical protein U9R51_04370 [Actinomycetota bacterium]|nr:hypothetical protein [Actinomycetota bacterium]
MGVTEGKATMRRLLIIAMATALLLSVDVGAVGAFDPDAWTGQAAGGMVATDSGHDGLTVDLRAVTRPVELNWTAAHGSGQYEYDGNAFRLRITHACVDPAERTVTVWGHAKVKSGSFEAFEGGTLVPGDKAYGVLSLLDEGDGIVSARAGIFDYNDHDGAFTMIAQQCEYPAVGSEFPATGPGDLKIKPKEAK